MHGEGLWKNNVHTANDIGGALRRAEVTSSLKLLWIRPKQCAQARAFRACFDFTVAKVPLSIRLTFSLASRQHELSCPYRGPMLEYYRRVVSLASS